MGANFDCVVWSLDKTKTIAKIWYPQSKALSSVPYIYTLSDDNLTLLDTKSGMPLITYENNSFKVLNDFTDWTLYIEPNAIEGLVTLTDGISIGVGGIVSKAEQTHATMRIVGKATINFQDSIWSQQFIEAKDVTFVGYSDEMFTDVSFIYSGSFNGDGITISNVDRIYSKNRVTIKNSDITDHNGASAMYIFGKYNLSISNSKIKIGRYISSNRIEINSSEIHINSMNPGHTMLFADYDINIMDSSVTLENHMDYSACFAIFISNGNLRLADSKLAINMRVFDSPNILLNLGNGYIQADHSTITIPNGRQAIHISCFGGCIRSNSDIITGVKFKVKQIESEYRFPATILGKNVIVTVSHGNVKSLDLVESVEVTDNDAYDFYEEDYEEYLDYATEHLQELQRNSTLEHKMDYTSDHTTCGDIIKIHPAN